MLNFEDKLINKLEQRLSHIKSVSKQVKDKKALTEYFESRLHRSILDYLLQKELFDTAGVFAKELNIQAFSDIDLFKEVFEIINKFKVVQKHLGSKQSKSS